MNKRNGIGLCIVLCLAGGVRAGDGKVAPWTIVSASDWHSAEGGVVSKSPQNFERNQQSEKRNIAGTVACKPDVVLIAGDMGSGHWTMGSLRKSGVLKKGETIEQAIHRLGEKTYRTMKDNFAAAGVERLWVCVGDHGIGDNDWAPGSERSRCVPYHRAIFGKSYNTDARGKWLWPTTVCGAPARPMGTKYQDTSFAARHKNVLVVSVDIFHQEGVGERLHPRHGSVNPDVAGKHLAWFEKILAAGRADKSIRYVFVQAHTPALPPIRGQSSSMMMADKFERSNLWTAMRKYRVDLYFAGEVHATTISKDPRSDVVQIVTDRHQPTQITVHDDKLEFQTFSRKLGPDGRPQADPLHEEHKVTLDKSGGKTVFVGGRGVLKPLDTRAVFIHYPFEKIAPTPFGPGGSGQAPSILNHGELDCFYDARTRNTRLVEGKLGRGLTFSSGGVVDVHGTGPFGFFDKTERTLAIWFRTDASGKYNLICGGSGIKGNKWGGGGFMDLALHGGELVVRTSAGESAVAVAKLNDGKWHHAALVVAPDARSLADLRVYVDGAKRPWAPGVDARTRIAAKMGIHGISLGATHRPVWKGQARKGKFTSFDGTIDDFAAWYRALSDAEIRTLHDQAVTKQLNASQVDRLFDR
jgi:hypothetical protein